MQQKLVSAQSYYFVGSSADFENKYHRLSFMASPKEWEAHIESSTEITKSQARTLIPEGTFPHLFSLESKYFINHEHEFLVIKSTIDDSDIYYIFLKD